MFPTPNILPPSHIGHNCLWRQNSKASAIQNTTSSILLYWAKFKHNFIPNTISTEHNMEFLWAMPAEIAAITYIQTYFIPVYMFRSSDLDVEWCYIVVVIVVHDCHSLLTLHVSTIHTTSFHHSWDQKHIHFTTIALLKKWNISRV